MEHGIIAAKVGKPYRTEDIIGTVASLMSNPGVGDPLARIEKGGRVIVKPNIVADLPAELGAVTDARVCLGICMHLAEMGLTPVVAESSSVGVDTGTAMALEYGIIREYGFQLIPLDGRGTITLDPGDGGSPIAFFDILGDAAGIITVPKLKTHDQTVATLGMKNLKGLLPNSEKIKVHRNGLNQGILRMYTCLRGLGIPLFSFVDGLVGMEGLGPVFGSPVHMGFLAFGDDLEAMDSFCCGMMGIDPRSVEHLELAGKAFGHVPYGENWLGLRVEPHKFKTASEALRERGFDGVGFRWEHACTGCKNTVLSSLSEMEMRDGCIPRVLLCAGRQGADVAVHGDPSVMVGNCSRPFNQCEPSDDWVPGCPPVNEDVIRAVDEAVLRGQGRSGE